MQKSLTLHSKFLLAQMAPDNVTYHIPALLTESIEALNIKPDGIYADATFGGGGHSSAILQALGSNGRLLGFDRDMDAYANTPADGRFTFVHSNFRFMRNFMRYHHIEAFDGILADLGVSFHHFDDAERGFSFRTDAPLDMRMNRAQTLSALQVVNEYSEEQLTSLFATYTDLKNPRGIARLLIKARNAKPIATTTALAEALSPAMNPKAAKKDLAQAFQAIRIEVNGEMDSLRKFLASTPQLLREGGRLAILTYHSIEDRIVKNFMKTGNVEGKVEKDFFGRTSSPWKLITRSPLTPSAREVEDNPRSRSAKLRVAELISKPSTEQLPSKL